MSETMVGTQVLVTEICCQCHMMFALPGDFMRKRRNDHVFFCCPDGHKQHYTGQSEIEVERKRREQADARATEFQRQRDEFLRSNRALRGVVTKARRRAAAGVCPCCTRHFVDLERHMGSKHPGYAEAKP